MKRFGVYAFIVSLLVIFVGGFITPNHVSASVTDKQITDMIAAGHSVFDGIDSGGSYLRNDNFADTYERMVKSVASKLKDDPDVSYYQLRRYVLEGIPGATDTDQTGFIPLLTRMIANPATSETSRERAKLALPQAQQLLSNSITEDKKTGGVITAEEADAERLASAQKNAAQTAAEMQDRTEKKCSILGENPISDCIDAGFSWLIKNTLLRFAGFLLFITASMLNYAVQLSILDFAKWAPDTLYPIWVIVRQIISLFVVFAGLYLGFMYILGDETKFGKYVGWLVIFALFVNFSYPFSRALVDISNIVSLNVYTSALGPEILSGNGGAGDIIKNKMGVQTLIDGVGKKEGGKADEQKINNVPGSLLAVAFVLYAAYIFFMATAIIAVRAGALVFLIVASPLLLVDSVIPKLGDAAMKARKIFFEQLIVAPVFMIMLALTLKFMDVFHSASGARTDSVAVFFNLLMMLIMLHIMIKVTKSISGQVGEYATGMMGKVGGFGLGVATGGAGLLARGSIGAAAARMRDSDWMRNNQDSKIGRGMHGLTNSLAQSTFDTRNIGMVKTGMAKAGLTGIGGMGMGQGSKNNYDDDFKIRSQKIQARASYIKDAGVRDRYLDQMTNTVGSKAQSGALRVFGLKGKAGRNDAEIIRDNLTKNKQKLADRYNAFKDEDKKREFLESQPEDIQEFIKNQKKDEVPVFKDTVSENTAPVQTKTNIETGAPTATPIENKTSAKKAEDEGVDMSYVEMAEGKPYTKNTETAGGAAPTYTPKGTVVPNGAITFNFNGVAHQSFTAAVKQAEKAKTATSQPVPAENKQAVAA